MESHFESQRDPASVRETLEAIGTDRGRIGERMTAETWWAAPSQGLGFALLVAAPAAALVWGWWAWLLTFLLSMGIFVGVEVLFRKRSGLSITRPAGPRGIWLLVALSVTFLVSVVTSMGLAVFGLTGWVIAVAVAAGVATALIVAAYDRAFAAEVSRAG